MSERNGTRMLISGAIVTVLASAGVTWVTNYFQTSQNTRDIEKVNNELKDRVTYINEFQQLKATVASIDKRVSRLEDRQAKVPASVLVKE